MLRGPRPGVDPSLASFESVPPASLIRHSDRKNLIVSVMLHGIPWRLEFGKSDKGSLVLLPVCHFDV